MVKGSFKTLIFLTIFLLPMMASAMAFAKPLYLFSELNGTVFRADKPVSGAKIERRYVWHWKDKTGEEIVVSDADGRFHFPAATESSLSARLMPHEPVIQQTIVISVDGKEYLAWKFTKHNYAEDGELLGKKLNLHCDLDASEEYRLFDPKAKLGYMGICRLD